MATKRKINEIFQNRHLYGEYHHLFPVLKKDHDKFYGYLRMPVRCFNYILSMIEKDLQRDWSNFHTQPIHLEERLVVTLRYIFYDLSQYIFIL